MDYTLFHCLPRAMHSTAAHTTFILTYHLLKWSKSAFVCLSFLSLFSSSSSSSHLINQEKFTFAGDTIKKSSKIKSYKLNAFRILIWRK